MSAAAAIRSLREDVEAAVETEAVEGTLGRGVHAYLGTLIRLVEPGDRDPDLALVEARVAVRFLRSVPRLPTPRPWSPSCPE